MELLNKEQRENGGVEQLKNLPPQPPRIMTKKSKPKYLSALKMQKVRSSDIPENRKGKAPVNAHKSAIQEQIAKEKALFAELIMLRDIRAAFARGLGIPVDDLSVYAEIGDADLYHQVNVKSFAKWEKLSDMFKGYLGFLLAAMFAGYSFTANVSKELEESWVKNDVDVLERVKRMLRKQLEKHDLHDIPLFLVVEGKSKSGKSVTHLHVHGYFFAQKPLDETRMQKVLEAAFYPKLKRDGRKSKPVVIAKSYEHPDPSKGPVHWVNYSLKNVLAPGSKIKTSKPYLSNSLRAVTKIFWSIIRPRGQRLTWGSVVDSRLAFGGRFGRTDWCFRRRMGSDRAAVAA